MLNMPDSLTNDILREIRLSDPHSHDILLETIRNYRNMKVVFSDTPSIYGKRKLMEIEYSSDSLIDSLLYNGAGNDVLLPARVSMWRSCKIAEFNIYGLLYKICNLGNSLDCYIKDIKLSWEKTLYLILIEEVYQLIIDRTGYSIDLRKKAAERLLALWEDNSEEHSECYIRTIVNLWSSRRTLVPVFGTMIGTFELMKLSSILSMHWHDFLVYNGRNTEMIQAIEEFIFGLSFEEISMIRKYMREKNMLTVSRFEISAILNEPDTSSSIAEDDPRGIYKFYQYRAESARYRELRELPGPQKTIEEMLLVFLLNSTNKIRV